MGAITATATGNSNSLSAAGGDLFLSSGVISGTSVTATGINLSATNSGSGNRGGNLFVLVANSTVGSNETASSDAILGGSPSLQGSTAGLSFIGAPSTPSASISSGANLSFTAGSQPSTFNPGGFTAITGGTISVNANGDSRLIVPIVAQGNISLSGFTGGTAAAPNSAILIGAGNLTISGAASSTSGTLSGSGATATVTGATTTGASVDLITSAGSAVLNSINVSGTSGGSIYVQTSQGISLGSNIYAIGQTGAGGSVTLVTSGNVTSQSINANGASGGLISISGSSFQIPSGASLAANGSTWTGGQINVLASGNITLSSTAQNTGNFLSATGATAGGSIYLTSIG